MSPEQQRIKIAEARGLKVIDVPFIPSQTKAAGCVFTDAARTEWRRCYPNSCGVKGIPDYPYDLNAMHEAEKMLFPKHEAKWAMTMSEVCGHSWRIIYTATAAQRAEAFLRTLNLWTEE